MAFLSRVLTDIRELAGEPATHAKYSDTRLLAWVQRGYDHVLWEANRVSGCPLLVAFDITMVAGTLSYPLPATIRRVIEMQMLDGSENIVWREQPRSIYNPTGYGVRFQGSTVVFSSDVPAGYLLRLYYIPSAADLLTGSLTSDAKIVNNTTTNKCVIDISATPSAGALDTRPNAYVGSLLRILTATTNNYEQDRMIVAHDVTTQKVTVAPAFTAALLPTCGLAGTVTYEVAPPLDEPVEYAIACWVAMNLLAMEGDEGRLRTMRMTWQWAIQDAVSRSRWFNALREGAQRDSSRGQKGVVTSYMRDRARMGGGI